jgi:hypothetical protein|tara:strand:+ start:5236 stop:5682 length:447 start_codon:yes stop_codon:yes gene_type:complete
MAQRIQSMSSIPFERETMMGSLAERGLANLIPSSELGMDTGTGGMPGVNAQNNQQIDYGVQSIRTNTDSARRQAIVGMNQIATKDNTTANTAQRFMMNKLTNTMYDQLDAASGGSSMMLLNAVMQDSTSGPKFVNHIQTAKEMYRNMG